MNKNKYLIYGVLIVVLVIIFVVLAAHKTKTSQAPSATNQAPAAGSAANLPPAAPVPQLTQAQTPKGQLPGNFPPKLPIEANAQVLQNQTILNSLTGQHDAQYIYVTTQTISQNLAAYQKYLAANKWKVVSTVNQPDFDAINASQASTTLSIILDYKSAAPQDQVSLNYIY